MINSDCSILFDYQQFGIKIPVPHDDHGWELTFDGGCEFAYPGLAGLLFLYPYYAPKTEERATRIASASI